MLVLYYLRGVGFLLSTIPQRPKNYGGDKILTLRGVRGMKKEPTLKNIQNKQAVLKVCSFSFRGSMRLKIAKESKRKGRSKPPIILFSLLLVSKILYIIVFFALINYAFNRYFNAFIKH